jgi:hypothetical protein
MSVLVFLAQQILQFVFALVSLISARPVYDGQIPAREDGVNQETTCHRHQQPPFSKDVHFSGSVW